jgi:phosphate transport system substrate-binding protein
MQKFLLTPKKNHGRTLTFLVSFLVFSLASHYSYAKPIIKIDGSSTVFPITEAVAEDFQIDKKGAVRVTVGISGTGGGFKKFCRGETDISNASRPILHSEIEECKNNGVDFIEMPIAFDALTVAVNPKNHWIQSLTVAELKKMWEPAAQRTITRWKQINPAWPDAEMKLYGAGADSGTFDYFTEAVVGKAKSSRGDFTASEDDNVLVQGVASDIYALGFFGFAYYIENQKKVKVVAVDNGSGGVIPSMQTVQDGSYAPLSRPIFIYVNAKSTEKPEVREFVNFYMNNAPELVKEVKYFPLDSKFYTLNIKHMQDNVLGTVFGGEASINLTIEELFTKSRSH